MSLADTSRRGAALNWRLAVKGIQSGSRFREALRWRRAFSSGMFMGASSSASFGRSYTKAFDSSSHYRAARRQASSGDLPDKGSSAYPLWPDPISCDATGGIDPTGTPMDLNYTKEESAFRTEVREFIRSHLPGDLSRKVLEHKRLGKEDYVRWQKILFEKGWIAAGWPVEHGGTGWSAIQRFIFEDESAAAGAPRLSPFGLHMVGPVIIASGSEAQKKRYLPRILSSEDWWCQGYSEPGSGSDLASLKTRAERKGDKYLVNGQKTWNTHGQWADMCFCLVRTSSEGKKQDGISFLLIDMHSPGITVRPIITLDGEHEVNEIWFENVEVPVQNLVGEENRGWTCAKFLLSHERTGIAGVGASKRELQYLKHIAMEEREGGRPLMDDPLFRDRVARVEIDLMALEITCLRVASAD